MVAAQGTWEEHFQALGRAGLASGEPKEGDRMNKAELVDRMAADAGISKGEAGRALDALVGAVESTLRSGGEVAITGFGKFSVSNRAARQGRNPQTGATIQIAASKVPKFSAGAKLKDAIKGY